MDDSDVKEGEDICPICVEVLSKGEDDVCYPLNCPTHLHHLVCLQKWCEIRNICPLCKQEFNQIIRMKGAEKLTVTVECRRKHEEEMAEVDDIGSILCMYCDRGDHEELLLLCDHQTGEVKCILIRVHKYLIIRNLVFYV
jgi:hypothetical protein